MFYSNMKRETHCVLIDRRAALDLLQCGDGGGGWVWVSFVESLLGLYYYVRARITKYLLTLHIRRIGQSRHFPNKDCQICRLYIRLFLNTPSSRSVAKGCSPRKSSKSGVFEMAFPPFLNSRILYL
jgi:hypothetical protein